MRVAAVVLHYRFWPGIRVALDALLAQSPAPDRVVVVDNDSDPADVAALRVAYPGVEVVASGANLGYAGGMNRGLALVRDFDAVLLLTHECRLAPGALEVLLDRLAAEPEVGAVGPVLGLLSDEGRVFSAGASFDLRTGRHEHYDDPAEVSAWRSRPPSRVAWLDGACLLLRGEALRAAGPLDEAYFMYYEEVDLQLRLARLGWRVECVPAAVAWQQPGAPRIRLMVRNQLRCLERAGAYRALLRRYLGSLKHAIWEVRARDEEWRVRGRARLLGVLDYTLRRWGSR